MATSIESIRNLLKNGSNPAPQRSSARPIRLTLEQEAQAMKETGKNLNELTDEERLYYARENYVNFPKSPSNSNYKVAVEYTPDVNYYDRYLRQKDIQTSIDSHSKALNQLQSRRSELAARSILQEDEKAQQELRELDNAMRLAKDSVQSSRRTLNRLADAPIVSNYSPASQVVDYQLDQNWLQDTKAKTERQLARVTDEIARATDESLITGEDNSAEINALRSRRSELTSAIQKYETQIWQEENKSRINNLSQETKDMALNEWAELDDAISQTDKSLSYGARLGVTDTAKYLRQSERKKTIEDRITNELELKGYTDEDIERVFTYLQREYEKSKVQKAAADKAEYAKDHPFLASLESIAYNLASGLGYLDAVFQNISGAVTDVPVNYYSGFQAYSRMANSIRDTIMSGESAWGEINTFLYSTGMSMADFLAAMPFGGAAAILLGGSAGTSAMHDALDRGATDGQALMFGLAAGTAEMLFEKISIERLIKTKMASGFESAIKNIALQGATEASEELFTSIANTISDAIIMGDKSEYALNKQAYMESGLSEEEAAAEAVWDLIEGYALDVLGGFVSGGIMSAGATAVRSTIEDAVGYVYKKGYFDGERNDYFVNIDNSATLEKIRTIQVLSHENDQKALRDIERQYQMRKEWIVKLEENAKKNSDTETENPREPSREAETEAQNVENVVLRPEGFDSDGNYIGAEEVYTEREDGTYHDARAQTAQNEDTRSVQGENADYDVAEAVTNQFMGEEQRQTNSPGLVRDQYVANNLDAATADKIDTVAKQLGVTVRFADSVDGGEANAQLRGSEISIEKNNPNPVMSLLGHEITHYMQVNAPKEYSSFKRAVQDLVKNDAAIIAEIYSDRGRTITSEGALDEAVANYAGELINNTTVLDDFIERHRENKSLIRRVLDAIRSFIGKLTGSEKRKARTAEGKLAAALEATRKNYKKTAASVSGDTNSNINETDDGDTKFSIKYDANNTPYVVIEEDILDGVPRSEWVRTVKDNLREKFPNGVTVGNNVIEINAQSRREMTFSNYMQRLMRTDRQLFSDKLKATNNADEIVQAARNWVNEALLHPRKDSIIDFARGEVRLRIGSDDYTAQVIVGNRGKGKLLLYDILYLKPTVIQEKRTGTDYTTKPLKGTGSRQSAPVLYNNISKSGENVNGRFSSEFLEEGANVNISDSDYSETDGEGKESAKNSLKGTENVTPLARIRSEGQRIQENLEYWAEQDADAYISRNDATKAAVQLVNAYAADLDAEDISGAIQDLYRYMKESPEYSEARRRAQVIAEKIVENAISTETLYDQYSELRSYLRRTPLMVSEADRQAIDGYNEFRKSNMGRLNLKNGDTNVDLVYEDLTNNWPELFNQRTTVEDKLKRISDVMADIYEPAPYDPLKGSGKNAVAGVTNKVLETFFDISSVKDAFSDSEALKLGTAKTTVQRLIREAAAQERAKADRQIKKIKEKYQIKEANRRTGQRTRETRRKIIKHLNDLDARLRRPTDSKHIPESFRTTVAALLDAVNLSSAFNVDPDTGRHISPDQGGELTQRTRAFEDLRKAYQEIIKEGTIPEDPDLLGDAATKGLIDDIIEMRDIPMMSMNLEQLDKIWRVVVSIETGVKNADRTLGQARYKKITDYANTFREGLASAAGIAGSFLEIDMVKLVDFLHMMGPAGDALYNELRNAQDSQTVKIKQAADWVADTFGDTEFDQWRHEYAQLKDFKLESGQTLTLTPAQVMEFYLLSQRKAGRRHILEGGARQGKTRRGKVSAEVGILPSRTIEGKIVSITEADIDNIVSSLTSEQIRIADAMGKFLSTTAAKWGNDASLSVYGYKKFRESNYWPIHVDDVFINSDYENRKGASIENKGFTKPVDDRAGAPIVINDIFDTFSDHVNDMSHYSSWLGALADLKKIVRYKYYDTEGKAGGTFKGALKDAYGNRAIKYLETVINVLNNGMPTTGGGVWNTLISNYKAASVGNNLRVVVQQPTAILRALAVIDPKYLAQGMAQKGDWELVKKWAPIAQWKDWGYFELNNGRSIQNILLGTDSKLEKVRQASMAAAGKADSITWTKIWNAVEAETLDKRPDLMKGSEEFYTYVAERFSDIINRTQVVDGILQRNLLMLDPDSMTKMLTSYMSEPITSYSMLMAARYDAKNSEAGRRKLYRTVMAVAASNVICAAFASLVSAMRDDDPEKSYWEKWLAAFIGIDGDEETVSDYFLAVLSGDLVGQLNPLNMIPLAKDIVSLITGYSPSRMDMAAVEDLVQAGRNFVKAFSGEGKYTVGAAALDFIGSMAGVFGIAFNNAKRDVMAIVNTLIGTSQNWQALYEANKLTYNMQGSNKGLFYDIAFLAWQEDDKTQYENICRDMIENGLTQEDIDSAIYARLKKTPDYEADVQEIVTNIFSTWEEEDWYDDLDEEERDKAEAKAEEYANAVTREKYDEDFEIEDGSWILKAREDGDLSDYIADQYKYGSSGMESIAKYMDGGIEEETAEEIYEAVSSIEKPEGESISNLDKYNAILQLDIPDADKTNAFGVIMGPELETESGNPSQFAKLKQCLDTGLSLEDWVDFKKIENYSAVDNYLEFTDQGLSSHAARALVYEFADLEPEEGYDTVTSAQKLLAIAGNGTLDDDEKLAASKAVGSESYARKLTVADSAGISAAEYATFIYETLDEYDRPNASGNYGTYTQEEITWACNSMAFLTDTQKAVIWQLAYGGTSAKNNPYSVAVGSQVAEEINRLKKEEAED